MAPKTLKRPEELVLGVQRGPKMTFGNLGFAPEGQPTLRSYGAGKRAARSAETNFRYSSETFTASSASVSLIKASS